MAFETGTASDAADFFSKLKTFLTTNSDLVAAGQAWTQVWTSSGDVVLKGTGLSGTDTILVGMRLINDPTHSDFRLMINGMTGVLTGATAIEGHVNSGALVGMYLDDNPMTYWFVASGRRFVAVAQVSTVFEALYGGFILPYATPSEYSTPLFVGGSRGAGIRATSSWRSTDDEHTHFPYPTRITLSTPIVSDSGALLLDPGGVWQSGVNRNNPPPTYFYVGPNAFGDGFGTKAGFDIEQQQGYDELRWLTRQCFGGDYVLTPLTLTQQVPADETFGVLDGCYEVSGYENSSTNIITVGSTDHLVIQNVFRTGIGDFWALALG